MTRASEVVLRAIDSARYKGETKLRLSHSGLKKLSPEIGELNALTSLDLSGNQLTELPESIGQLTALTHLNLHRNKLAKLPESFGRLRALTELHLSANQLIEVPESIGDLTALANIRLSSNRLVTLPQEIGRLSALTQLSLNGNQLAALPQEIGNLTALNTLGLRNNRLTKLPKSIGKLGVLARLDLCNNDLQSLPPEIQGLNRLEELYLHSNKALGIPDKVLGPTPDQLQARRLVGGLKSLVGWESAEAMPSPPAEILAYYFEHNPPPSRAPSNRFHSCFISYTHTDKPFARRLYDALQARGVECWLDEKDLRPGDPILDHVNEAIRTRDKMLLCCSEQSLTSYWVDTEIGAAIQAERKTGSYRLIPLDLDGFLLSGWDGPKAEVVRGRLAADFTGWETDGGRFEAALEGVVSALRVEG